MRKHLALLVGLCLTAAACTATGATGTTIAPQSTTTAAPSTTTTTLPPVVQAKGAGEGVLRFLTGYYGYASGRSAQEPAGVPTQMLPASGAYPDLGTVNGEITVATYKNTRIAIFESEGDVLGLVVGDSGWEMVGGHAPSVGVAAWHGDEPILIAVVGSDARPGEDILSTRADSIHFLGLSTNGGAGLVGIPRDSYVAIPGFGTSRINASLQEGGAELMMATFEQFSGLDLTGYVLTGFEGFQTIVNDVLLPFELDVPFAFSDTAAKANFEQGLQIVDGRSALAFVRTRKAFSSGDFQRQLNGGLLLMAALGMAKIRGRSAIPEIIAGTEQWMASDLTAAQMLRFALAAHNVNLTEVSNVVLEGSNATTSGGASIVRVNEASAAATFADLADGSLG